MLASDAPDDPVVRDALEKGELLLRDIIDLDATYGAGPDVSGDSASAEKLNGAAVKADADEEEGADADHARAGDRTGQTRPEADPAGHDGSDRPAVAARPETG